VALITDSPGAETLDRAAILERVEGDEELLKEIVQLFIEDCPRLVKQMRECLDAKDAPSLRMAAHTLKGSLSYFGPSKACALAFELEILGRDGNLVQAASVYETLLAKLDELQPLLAGLMHNTDSDA
jgi:HPt (histidine-containing phosphotransfer) domain-containing protein